MRKPEPSLEPPNFTLIELLVVVAIIAILMAILLPALSSAKGSAQRIACEGNLKQCIIGSSSYSGDYGGYFPASYVYPYPGVNPVNSEVRWFGFLYCLDYVRASRSALCPTLLQNAVEVQSAMGRDLFSMVTAFQCHSYGQRAKLSSSVWVKASTMSDPSNKIVYGDSCYEFNYSGVVEWVSSHIIETDSVANNNLLRTFHLRHGNSTANAAFIDGHVMSATRGVFREYGITGGRTADFYDITF